MKHLLLTCLIVLVTGCGETIKPVVIKEENTRPGFSWSPMVGVIITATETPHRFVVSVRCIDYYDMLHNTLSVTEHPCETMDYTGKAYFLITREQLQDWSEYRTRYYDN